jgi:hypothetical protein
MRSGGVKLLVGIVLALALFSVFSGAIIDSDGYVVGQDLKVDLSNFENYVLKISTPSNTFLREGSRDVFLFPLDEVGNYRLGIDTEDLYETYSFKVYESEGELEKDSSAGEGSDFIEPVDAEDEIKELNRNDATNDISSSPTSPANPPGAGGSSGNETEGGDDADGQEGNVVDGLKQSTVNSGPLTPQDHAPAIKNGAFVVEAEIGKPVVWRKEIEMFNNEIRIEVPYSVEDVDVRGEDVDFGVDVGVVERVVSAFSESSVSKEIVVKKGKGNVAVRYTTPAPEKMERKISSKVKEVVVSAPDYLGYENVTAFADLTDVVRFKDEVRVYWKEEGVYLDFDLKDKDNDGFAEEVEWIVPHLSTQTFVIIVATNAEHFDADGNYVGDVFSNIRAIDDVWVNVSDGEYVRVTFEKQLISKNDITIFARSGNAGSVEVYERGSNVKIADFGEISEVGYYKILLTELPFMQDTFDLKVVDGYVEFDLIIDPMYGIHFTGFEADTIAPWDGWVDGGVDCLPSTSLSAVDDTGTAGGSRSIEVQDNDVGSYTAQTFDLSAPCDGQACEYIMFSLYLYPSSYDKAGEGFEIWCDYGQASAVRIAAWDDNDGGTNACGNIAGISVCELSWSQVIFNLTDLGCLIDSNLELRVTSQDNAINLGNADQVYVDGMNVYGPYMGPPYMGPIFINSTDGSNKPNRDLNCFTILYEDDLDPVDVSVRWYKDGNLFSTVPYSNGYTNGTNFVATLDNSNVNDLETWMCSVQADDGSSFTSWENSSEIFVSVYGLNFSSQTCSDFWGFDCGENPPESSGDNTFDSCSNGMGADESVEELYLNVTKILAGSSVEAICEFDAYESAGDTYFIEYHNGTAWRTLQTNTIITSVGNTENRSVVFSADNVVGNHTVRCSINYNVDVTNDYCANGADGYYDNDDLWFEVVSTNIEPDVPVVLINSSSGNNYLDDDLNCYATITDLDADFLDVTVTWTRNSIFYSSVDYNNSYTSGTVFVGTLDSSNTAIGDNWSCSLSVRDYEAEVSGFSGVVTILPFPMDYGMHLKFSDTFTGANGNLYSTHTPDLGVIWTEIYNDASYLQITDSQLDAFNARNDGAAGVGTISGVWNADQMITATYSGQDNGDDLVHLLVRADESYSNAYIFSFSITAANTRIWKRVGDLNTDLQNNCGGDNQFTVGDVVTLKVVGTTIEVYDGSLLICSVTDSDLNSGSPGVGIGSSPRDGAGDVSNQRLDNVLMYSANNIPTSVAPIMISATGPYDDATDYYCSGLVDDLDGDSLTGEVRWYRDGVLDSTGSESGVSAGSNISVTLSGSRTTAGEAWKCSMRANDGNDESVWLNSSEYVLSAYVVPPRVTLDLLYPTGNVNMYQNEMSNVTVRVNCLDADCGAINLTLDPIQETFENFESGEGGFSHAVISGVDQWHRSSESSHDGSFSFKFGDTGTGNYGDVRSAYLETPVYDIEENSTFSFYHYVNTEDRWDGAKLEYSVDGGAWTKVTSFISGGYSGTLQNSDINGFTNGENIWTNQIGSAGAFSLVEVDMTPFVSNNDITFRFIFGSDTNTNDEGWYVDSVNFTTEIEGGSKGVIPMNSGAPFYTTTQNPYVLNLNQGTNQVVVFNVNSTGSLDTTYEFFAYANVTATPYIGDRTVTWNATIRENIKPVAVTINSPNGTFADPTLVLDLTLADREADTLWYNLNGGPSSIICNDCIGGVTEVMNIDAEGSFTVNVYANNSNGDLTHETTSVVVDMNNNFYDSFLDNHSVFNYGDSFWNLGSLNYTATQAVPISDDFEATSVTFPTLIDGTGGSGCAWYRDSGGTTSGSTGPSSGHSSTYYAYVETSNGQCYTAGDTAIIESVDFNLTGESANLSFWYHMYGSNMGTMKVEIFDGDSWIELWSRSGQDQSAETDPYENVNLDLTGYSGVVKIRFVGVAIGNFRGDMAIDDVYIIEPISRTEVMSRTISMTDVIAEFTDVTWNYDGSASGDVKINLSVDGGTAWVEATSGAGVVGFTSGNDLGSRCFD